MSVLIKGMKMPNSCVECPLYKESVCDAFETLAPYTFKDNERALFCPLTEVAEPKTGEWIIEDAHTEHCSVCGYAFYISALFAVGGNDEPNYCPNCGAKMRGEKHE